MNIENTHNCYQVVIIGAGHSGISLSYYLQQHAISHIILESDVPFSKWYQRWLGFRMNTVSWMNQLPGMEHTATEINSTELLTKKQMLAQFLQWLDMVNPDIRLQQKVINLSREKNTWLIKTLNNHFRSKVVVIATGYTHCYLPELKNKIPDSVTQLHSSDYRQPQQIKTNRVLVVGSGSSGVQICEQLAKSKQFTTVYLSCSHNRRFSWKIFGVSIHEITKFCHGFDIRSNSLLGKVIRFFASSKGDPATPPSPTSMVKTYAVRVMKKVVEVSHHYIIFTDKRKISIDDLTIIWCTGFYTDFTSFFDTNIAATILNKDGSPSYCLGEIRNNSGLYFIGLRFQRLLSSHIIYGAVRDAKIIVNDIVKYLKKL